MSNALTITLSRSRCSVTWWPSPHRSMCAACIRVTRRSCRCRASLRRLCQTCEVVLAGFREPCPSLTFFAIFCVARSRPPSHQALLRAIPRLGTEVGQGRTETLVWRLRRWVTMRRRESGLGTAYLFLIPYSLGVGTGGEGSDQDPG